MAKSYTDIQKQIENLKAKAATLRAQEVKGVITRIRNAIETYGLSAADLGLGQGRGPKPKAATKTAAPRKRTSPAKGKKLGKVPVKYRDKNGNTWTGRGNQPVWLREAVKSGAKIESFLV